MKKKLLHRAIVLVFLGAFISCEKDFEIKLPPNTPKLIVEGYINNALPLYNYVVLTRSQDFNAPGILPVPVSGATVYVTEGDLLPDGSYRWDTTNRVRLREVRIPGLDTAIVPGFYFDVNLALNPARALRGTPGKHYLLEIGENGKQYTAITSILQPVPIDSLTLGNYYEDEDDGITTRYARLTLHYKDPDTIGNAYLHYWKELDDRTSYGWGGFDYNRFLSGTDELINGQYLHITQSSGFVVTDSVDYYLVHVPRNVYNFWDSFNKARDNGGPFSTPVTLQSTVKGEDVIGCFSGFSVSVQSKRIE